MAVGDAEDWTLSMLPKGMALLYGTTVGGSATNALSVLRKLGFPKRKRGKSDAVDLQQTSDEKFKSPGFFEHESVSVKARMRKADMTALDTLFNNATPVNWIFKLPLISGESVRSQMAFSGWVEELGVPEVTAGQDDRIDLEFMIHATAFVWTAGS